MEEFEKQKEPQEVNLTVEQEFRLEKDIQANLIKAENVEEVKEQMEKLVSLERNSKNGRAIAKTEDCMGVLNLGCVGANIGNEIASSLAKDLYPELYRNIALKREKIEVKDLVKMATSLRLLYIGNKRYDGVDSINKEMIENAFIKLIQLLPPEDGERE